MEPQGYWPDAGAQAVMQQWCKAYPLIAYGRCFRLGVCMQMGLSLPEATRHVEASRDTIDHTCGWGE